MTCLDGQLAVRLSVCLFAFFLLGGPSILPLDFGPDSNGPQTVGRGEQARTSRSLFCLLFFFGSALSEANISPRISCKFRPRFLFGRPHSSSRAIRPPRATLFRPKLARRRIKLELLHSRRLAKCPKLRPLSSRTAQLVPLLFPLSPVAARLRRFQTALDNDVLIVLKLANTSACLPVCLCVRVCARVREIIFEFLFQTCSLLFWSLEIF